MSAFFVSQAGFPKRVRVVEVGPRDGLQNEASPVSADARVALIHSLAAAGLKTIECGSFVSPKWVPQMAGTDEVLRRLVRVNGVSYPVLVPNLKGLRSAIAAGATAVAVFASASETFSLKNTNAGISESLRRIEEVLTEALSNGLRVRGYVSCVMGCPFEGSVSVDAVVRVAGALAAMGCYEVSLGDTIGVGTPLQTRTLIQAVRKQVPIVQLAVHFHDTRGQALANVLTALDLGVAVVDSSVAGLGGCPYAPGASGNLATEDLLYMLHGMGIETGADLLKVAQAGAAVCEILGRKTASRAALALLEDHPGE